MCFNHVCRNCTGRQCNYKHPPPSGITDSFAIQLCNILHPSIDYLLNHGDVAPGRQDIRGKHGRGEACMAAHQSSNKAAPYTHSWED